MPRRNGSTRKGRAENARILATSDTCGICGHPGSDAVDHIIPLARGGPDTPANKQPAHHNTDCPTCGQRCNRVKGDKLVPPTLRRSGALH
jgi:5-methylcytosine-specific restriction endonuclease McrA